MFEKLDKNNDGMLSFDEIKVGLKDLDPVLAKEV